MDKGRCYIINYTLMFVGYCSNTVSDYEVKGVTEVMHNNEMRVLVLEVICEACTSQ